MKQSIKIRLYCNTFHSALYFKQKIVEKSEIIKGEKSVLQKLQYMEFIPMRYERKGANHDYVVQTGVYPH